MKRLIQRLWRGYSASDLEILRLKIGSGLDPKDARLTRYEGNALVAMSRAEVCELCSKAFDG